MVSAQIWITVFLKVVFAILGCYFVTSRLTPILGGFMVGSIKDQKAIRGFVYLINVFVIVFTASLVLGFLSQLGTVAGAYILAVKPGLDVVSALFSYIDWVLVALVLVIAFKSIINGNGKGSENSSGK